MDDNLYYCRHLQHVVLNIEDNVYGLCISDKINENIHGSTIQFHGILTKNLEVANIYHLNNTLSKSVSKLLLEDFETDMRKTIRKNMYGKKKYQKMVL